jgi:polyhydroxybutyrate depolymerase
MAASVTVPALPVAPASAPLPPPPPPPPPPVPSTPAGVLASAGDAQVVLSWSASTDSLGIAGYRVFRNGSQVAQVTGTSYTDSGLTDGTTYSYTVIAIDTAGTVSAACGAVPATPVAPPAPRPGTIVYRPPGLSLAKPVPLVLGLHGAGGTAQGLEGQSKLEELANQDGFVVVLPESLTPLTPWQSPTDIPYLQSLLASVDQSQNIDMRRQYVTGFSAGGREAYTAACQLSQDFAAVAVVSSAPPAACAPTHPVSELLIYGSLETSLANGNAATGFPSASAIASQWRSIDGCATSSSATQVGPTAQTTWGSCTNGSAVGLYTVNGGTHFWPGQNGGTGPDAPGVYSGTNAVWQFFVTHPYA